MEPRRTRPLLPFAVAVTLWAPCPVGAEPIPDPPPGIQSVIETDNHIYPIGENVLAVQKVVNPSPWKFTLALNMTPGFDLWVLEDGVTIWSQHTCFFLYGSSVIVEPGETLQYDYAWDMTDYEGSLVGPGEYEVRSVINGGGENVSTGITIVPEPVTLGILLLTSGLLLRKKPTSASR